MLTTHETGPRIDPATFTLTFERSLSVSREKVFDAWTQPQHVAAWWDPTGTPLRECTIDLRKGGSFRFVNDGHSPPFEGVYSVVDRPVKLVFDALGAVGTVLIESRAGRTHLTVTIRCASAEHLEQLVKVGVAAGTDRTIDNLVAHLGAGSA
ncbi:MAG: Activator of Hsp90 ATPase 1 family protein [Labilithrix sp.]|nr:Activator of Hsp90 ATPase 1 family protein [Labilithrix sp.]